MAQDYPYIRKWGRMMGSQPSYIQEQITRARNANAPQNATYEQSERDEQGRLVAGKWHTTDDNNQPLGSR